ncbi:type II toxin-antitoxin system RelE/ParE family toxin [Bartonella sp. AA23NXGY]|uniref:type II toxin-antitoxin system RelE/ParE family toxin n=1 Tax=Bartonella sp. AA23NXGY TaxID=3243431 RepID=UPI0035D038C4
MLKGDFKDYWLITVNGNCCVIFRFDSIDVEMVDYLDCHQKGDLNNDEESFTSQ